MPAYNPVKTWQRPKRDIGLRLPGVVIDPAFLNFDMNQLERCSRTVARRNYSSL
jgi:hypothetical protein